MLREASVIDGLRTPAPRAERRPGWDRRRSGTLRTVGELPSLQLVDDVRVVAGPVGPRLAGRATSLIETLKGLEELGKARDGYEVRLEHWVLRVSE